LFPWWAWRLKQNELSNTEAMEEGYKSKLQKNWFKEIRPCVYSLRDWDEIRSWAKELTLKTKEQ
jgi:hypothetical protein